MSSTNETNHTNPYAADIPAILLSSIAYCSSKDKITRSLKNYLPDWRLVWVPVEGKYGNYAFVAQKGNQYMISIRGSLLEITLAAFYNWVAVDLDVLIQREWNYPWSDATRPMISEGSHFGLGDLNELVGDGRGHTLFQFIRQLPAAAEVTVTGHSLGGGLAPVYALYLNYQLHQEGIRMQPISVVSFAGPTTGNAAFAALFNASFSGRARLYVDVIDIVPFAANNFAGISNLYSGDYPYAPKAPEELVAIFKTANDSVRAAEYLLDSYYTPLNGTIQLNTDRVEIHNDHTSPVLAWITQAGDQHAHNHYLQLMGYIAEVFSCPSNEQVYE